MEDLRPALQAAHEAELLRLRDDTALKDVAKSSHKGLLDLLDDFDKHDLRWRPAALRAIRTLIAPTSASPPYDVLGACVYYNTASIFIAFVVRFFDAIDPNARMADDRSVFQAAASLGSLECMQVLSRKAADLQSADRYGRTPLQESMRSPRQLRWLASVGANLQVLDRDGRTVLHNAAFEGLADSIEILLDGGAHVDALDREGRTPLWAACNRVRPYVVKLLLQAGANPNHRDKDGRFPLQLRGNLAIARMLLDAGADPAACSRDGRPVLEMMASRRELCALIRTYLPSDS